MRLFALALGRGVLACLQVVALVAAADTAAAQELQFRRLTPDDGLVSSRVHDIVQDGRGFIWIGSDKGLSRYDGYAFVNYRGVWRERDSLPHSYVEGLYVDRGGTLWAGTRAGLSRYDAGRDAWTTFLRDSTHDFAGRLAVISMLEDRRGNFWVGTSGGLLRLDRLTGRATDMLFTGRTSQYVTALHEDSGGQLWIGTLHNGAYRFDPVTGALRHFRHDPRDPRTLPGKEVRTFLEDAQGRLWIGMYDGGLAWLDRSTDRVTRFRHSTPGFAEMQQKRIYRLHPAQNGGFWVGTEDQGLEHVDPVTGRVTHYLSNRANPRGLSNNSVWAVYQEPSGTLWVGTFAGGVNVSLQHSRAIRHFRNVPGAQASLSHDAVTAFAEDREGAIWIGTDGGGLNRFDRRTGEFTNFSPENTNLNRAGVVAMTVDQRDGVWIGTWAGGVSRFDRATRRFTAYTTANSELPEDNIFSLHLDRAGRLWAGTLLHGLAHLDPATGRVKRYLLSQDDVVPTIRGIGELHDGRIVCALEGGGIAVLDPNTGQSRRYTSVPGDPHSLATNTVLAVYESEPGVVWAGTDAGLDRLDLRTGRVTHVTTRDGLPSDRVVGIVGDDKGMLWLSTDRGISRFDPRSGRADNFSAADGLQGTEFNMGAFFRARDGALFFGGSNGFNLVQPSLIARNARPPRVVFTGFQLFNRSVGIGTPGSPLTTHISTTRALTLSPRQSVFTVEFAALDYAAPSKNRYAYRLEGFDADWVQAGTARTATYTNLPPGDYVFRVRASNGDGVWNEDGASLRIKIQPPFWRTWWFRTLVILVVSGTSAFLALNARRRRRRLEAMNARLAQASERDRASQQYLERNVAEMLGAMQSFSEGNHTIALEVATDDEIGRLRRGFNAVVADRKRTEEELRQTQKMDAVGRLAGGIAHDFNNLLTVIKGNTELAIEGLPEGNEIRAELVEVEKAAQRAESLTRQLLAFSRKQVLQPRFLLLDEVVGAVSRMLGRTLGEDIHLHVDLAAADEHVRADPGQLEQVLLNLVLNARDAMPQGGDLWVETRVVTTTDPSLDARNVTPRPYVALAVRDTGVGIEPAVLERIFEPFFTTKGVGKGTGLGLSTVDGIVAQSGGFVRAESAVGQATTFTVFLPCVAPVPAPADSDGGASLSPQPRGYETVLVCEDEDGVRQLACTVLARAGFTVLRAANGPEALELASAYPGAIELLLTDVVMPRMNGRELAEHLRTARPDTRVLFMSGYTEDAVLLRGVSTRAAAFVEKPFSPDRLVRAVRGAIDAPHEAMHEALA